MASRNSIWAIGLIHTFVQSDPPDIEFDSLLRVLGRSVFEYGEEIFPTKLDNLRLLIGESQQVGEIYWPVYSYLFALFPDNVETRKIGNCRWSPAEYRQLVMACLTRWHKVNKGQDSSSFMEGYNEMRRATQAWFKRDEKIGQAKEFCIDKASAEIERLFPDMPGTLSARSFRSGIEGFLDILDYGFHSYLKSYWPQAGAFSFFASDKAPLPAFITGDLEAEKKWFQS